MVLESVFNINIKCLYKYNKIKICCKNLFICV